MILRVPTIRTKYEPKSRATIYSTWSRIPGSSTLCWFLYQIRWDIRTKEANNVLLRGHLLPRSSSIPRSNGETSSSRILFCSLLGSIIIMLWGGQTTFTNKVVFHSGHENFSFHDKQPSSRIHFICNFLCQIALQINTCLPQFLSVLLKLSFFLQNGIHTL